MKTHENAVPPSLPKSLQTQPPFSFLPGSVLEAWTSHGQVIQQPIGSTILRADELPCSVLVVLQGEVRLLIPTRYGSKTWKTISKRGPGQLLGWSSLLSARPCELVIAAENTTLMALPADEFIDLYRSHHRFAAYFNKIAGLQELHTLAQMASEHIPAHPDQWLRQIEQQPELALITVVQPGEVWSPPPEKATGSLWLMSTAAVPGFPMGTALVSGQELPRRAGFKLPYRLIGLPCEVQNAQVVTTVPPPKQPGLSAQKAPPTLEELGITEADELGSEDVFPFVKGRGELAEAMAALEMLCLSQHVPFRRDGVQKILEDQFRRDKGLTLELLAVLTELLGFSAQLVEIDPAYIASLEVPAILMMMQEPCIYYGLHKGSHVLGCPRRGLLRLSNRELSLQLPSDAKIRVALPRRTVATPTSRFGWSWFTPLLRKYQWPLLMVFGASLLAQLFNLGIPLLTQQLIDKVLAQGNLSSLNILGAAMVIMALFRGVLTVLRTYIFVDTTDRMDLALGSAVIDRLLGLPLTYFEKRPVGELSQRIGELNNIRSFLTGTALVSSLNIIFATLYIIVMLLYSPMLTAVSLSTLPLYLLIVLVVSPIYKAQIRRRAVAQAQTQSHLIEVIGGIQTVKAQHFELTARWRWQDKYRHFVEEGFKSTALGTSSSEIGNFLNQLSSLLVLWVGMWLVLKGDMTLGMLIAFRIISGNVIGPITQLSGLYQGVQGVQLSMERLSDILDQNSELNPTDESASQISLPPITGAVRFEKVCFGFDVNGPRQLENISIAIPAGSFVGVVGQSGSGKSTLMKLLPRLYDPQSGRIFIDDYDIAKVNLQSLRRQIGIVPQDSLLFEGSISDNIALNDPQASSESIIAAAKLACAHEFIMALGKGYATTVAERGTNLSGGQRQRIAIARTILANPQMLVMDEATSALDVQTERELSRNLQAWAQHRTVFFITHRLSTIRASDVILVMHQGHLVENGTHQQLMDMQGRYWALYRQQEFSS